ncbi:sphingosine-1-phosphate lyase [Monosporozyma servazzii]
MMKMMTAIDKWTDMVYTHGITQCLLGATNCATRQWAFNLIEIYQNDPMLIIKQIKLYFQLTPWYFILRDYLFLHFIYRLLSNLCYNIRAYGLVGYPKRSYRHVSRMFFQWLLNSPMLKNKVDKEVNKTKAALEKEMIRNNDLVADFPQLPINGLSSDLILQELDKLETIIPHSDWEDGKVSGAVYHGGSDLIHLQSQAFEKFCVANQLHPDVFPALRKMEAEVVAMTLKMFNAPEDTGCGTTTSGGTESLLLACLSAKMYGERFKGITEPEMVIPETAHAGFDKAAYYFGIKLRHVKLDPVTFKVDLKQMERMINKNTVLLAGSVPNFPHGIGDDISGISKLAIKYDIRLHVDCCLGSFIVAFMEKAGYGDEIDAFDFRVPGVTSISCDTHKYGFAPKGSSVIMYRNDKLRMQQYYVNPDWVGGLYGSPTLAGSRPGALVVGCWATMINMGEVGYIESCKEIVEGARKLKKYIQERLSALEIIGDPKFSVIAFKSNKLDVHELSDKLNKRGWHLSALQKPAALHLAVTKLSVKSIDDLCQDLTDCVHEILSDPQHVKHVSSDGTSALYGVAGSVKSTGVVDRLIVGFLDALYKLKPDSTLALPPHTGPTEQATEQADDELLDDSN